MIEGTPTPECQVAEYEVILEKLKQQAREAIEKADESKSILIKEFGTKRIILGVPDHPKKMDYTNESVSNQGEIEESAPSRSNVPAKSIKEKSVRSKRHHYITTCVILLVAFFTVTSIGTIFYQMSKTTTKGRFDEPAQVSSE
ncbi:hypothetical protein QR680_015042 [Steinernema hermaphroditum]|uniref:Uncharacterized protein n=1 Tax=Steinernema hermaphroditum TaxID=289476 RepID=A0AA39IAY6_9BILA|nr:hypothetical protein QR680_015042 [Steinernema hermaphroditum]